MLFEEETPAMLVPYDPYFHDPADAGSTLDMGVNWKRAPVGPEYPLRFIAEHVHNRDVFHAEILEHCLRQSYPHLGTIQH
jgi:hypothetical protein